LLDENRSFVTALRKRINESGPLIQVLVGPRQVGKTTAVRAVLAGRGVYETADSPTPLPSSIVEGWWKQGSESPEKILAIDEIQKIPGWSEVVKKCWDRAPRALKVILTGSSSLLLEKALRESLAGRFELIRAEHWNFGEARGRFDLSVQRFVEFGCYPGGVPFLNDLERWGAYLRDSIVEPVLGRDLLQMHPVEQPALLRQVFGVAVSHPAEIVSLQKIQGQMQGKGTLPTIQNYLRLLKEAFLITPVGKFSSSGLRIRGSSPKLVVHDNGLVRCFERPVHAPLSPDRAGRYVENAVGARLIESGFDLFYWKDRNLEVDWVAVGPDGRRWAIEVKSGEIFAKDLDGLSEFCRRHPDFEPYLVSAVGQTLDGFGSLALEDVLSLHRT
jgi:predicted AAA+ superfamily ATPase